MGQISFGRHPVGSVGLALFLLGISAFAYSILDPVFGPVAIGCLAAGGVVAILLAWHRRQTTRMDASDADTSDKTTQPIEPQ